VFEVGKRQNRFGGFLMRSFDLGIGDGLLHRRHSFIERPPARCSGLLDCRLADTPPAAVQ
jgi:hypothetical protein